MKSIKNGDILLKLSPDSIPDEYNATVMLDIIRRYCNHNKILIKADVDNDGNYSKLEFINKITKT